MLLTRKDEQPLKREVTVKQQKHADVSPGVLWPAEIHSHTAALRL